jgi:hypothetical protein
MLLFAMCLLPGFFLFCARLTRFQSFAQLQPRKAPCNSGVPSTSAFSVVARVLANAAAFCGAQPAPDRAFDSIRGRCSPSGPSGLQLFPGQALQYYVRHFPCTESIALSHRLLIYGWQHTPPPSEAPQGQASGCSGLRWPHHGDASPAACVRCSTVSGTSACCGKQRC